MDKLSKITRGDIIECFQFGFPASNDAAPYSLCWYGRITPFKFLDELYDLSKLPAYDRRSSNAGGDIILHTETFSGDYKDDFIFKDDRFNLNDVDDGLFLKFLSRVFDPSVRDEKSEWKKALDFINSLLREDGYEIYEIRKISGRSVYGYREYYASKTIIVDQTQKVIEAFDLPYIHTQTKLMIDNIDIAPYDSIGKSKELLESCCKIILSKTNVEINDDWNLINLVRETCKKLKLLPNDIPDDIKTSGSIKKILGNLANIGQGIAELRNEYGSGHGKDGEFKGLNPRHARLAVGACTTAVVFLWETYDEKAGGSSPNIV